MPSIVIGKGADTPKIVEEWNGFRNAADALRLRYMADTSISGYAPTAMNPIAPLGPSETVIPNSVFNYGVSSVPSMCGMYFISGFSITTDPSPAIVRINETLNHIINWYYNLYYQGVVKNPQLNGPGVCNDTVVFRNSFTRWTEQVYNSPSTVMDKDVSAKLIAQKLYDNLFDRNTYTKRSQYILTDNLRHFERSYAVSRIVRFLPGTVFAGPLTNNENHSGSGRVQTYIWVPEGGDMDKAFGYVGGAFVMKNKAEKPQHISSSSVRFTRATLTSMFKTPSNSLDYLMTEDN